MILILRAKLYQQDDIRTNRLALSPSSAKLSPIMTKRQLGLGIAALAIVGAVGIIAVDLVGAGDFQGIGPAQRLALLAAGGVLLVGLSLIPLGDRPA